MRQSKTFKEFLMTNPESWRNIQLINVDYKNVPLSEFYGNYANILLNQNLKDHDESLK